MTVRRYETCYYCRYWLGEGIKERGPKGTCRRFPPTVTSRAPLGAFPTTLATGWCGEWQRSVGRDAAATMNTSEAPIVEG
jgi:hypothetical protein